MLLYMSLKTRNSGLMLEDARISEQCEIPRAALRVRAIGCQHKDFT